MTRPSRAGAAAAAVLGFLALAWWLCQTPGEEPPPAQGGALPPPRTALAEASKAVDRPAPPTAPAAIAVAPFAEPEALDSSAGDADGDGTIDVLVVERGSGRPLPGATVRWDPDLHRLRLPSDPFADVDPAEEFERHADRAVADDQGRAVLPWISPLVMSGTWGDLVGRTSLFAPAGEVTFELWPTRPVRAHVRSAAGAPVPQVPVRFQARTWWRNGFEHFTAITGADGFATAALSPLTDDVCSIGQESVISAEVPWPLGQAVRAVIPVEEASQRALELLLPPTGRVVVRIVGTGGRPVHDPVHVCLGGPIGKDTFLPAGPRSRTTTRESFADLEPVGIGVPLGVIVLAEGYDVVTADVPAIGGAGSAEVTVRLGDRRAAWPLRALDENGSPAGSRWIHLVWESAGERFVMGCTESAETDDRGRFEVKINRPPFLGCGGTAAIDLLGDRDQVVAVAHLRVPGDLDPGPASRKDVRFARPAVLARGVVTGEDGRPLARAIVRVASWSPTSRLRFPYRSGRPPSDAVTGADGSFVLSGRDGDAAETVSVARRGFEAEYGVPVPRDGLMRLALRRAR